MNIYSSDTRPEVEKVLISLVRSTSRQKKLNLIFSFSSEIINFSKRAIQRANPQLNERDRDLLFVKYHYGEYLAEQVKNYLLKNNL